MPPLKILGQAPRAELAPGGASRELWLGLESRLGGGAPGPLPAVRRVTATARR